MRACAFVLALVAFGCSSSGSPGDGTTTPGDTAGTPGSPDAPGSPGTPGAPPAAPTLKKTGEACAAAAECESQVCTGGTCAAPSATDGVKNGDETDVDCGGSSGKTCDATKTCKVHADCTTQACLDGTCAFAKSCRQHNGGATCGSGEPGAANAQLEDCCTSIDVPRPAAQGGPYKMDKYLITAGRMRAFIDDVKEDVRSWANANPPPGWNATWAKSVPANHVDVVQQLGAGQQGATSYGGSLGPGCYVQGMGAPAFWFSEADQKLYNGDIARAFTQDELDTKVMNCATRALFAAFCAWDGGRLPTYEEWKFAVNGGDNTKTYPWGNTLPIGNFASYDFNYSWPRALANGDLDRGAILPAPGRFPQGKGPFGHMDLAGAVENFSSSSDGGWMQYSFQEAGKEQYNIVYGTHRTWGPSTKHWAVGARCVRP